jgi:glycosyltransferase involved in cell wall biosynthesis
VVAISEDFIPVLDRWRVEPGRVTVIPNWAPLDEAEPMPRSNPWSTRQGLDGVPVFLYAGTLGRKHDPGLLLLLADHFPEAITVVVSEGPGTERLRPMADRRKNLILLPLQPAEQLPHVLASADVLVALLEADASVFSVPSKVLTYLAAGRPILAGIPTINLAARTIQDSNAGYVVEPSDHEGFVGAARTLLADPEARARAAAAGREYAERAFEIGAIADRFEVVLETAVQQAHSTRAQRADTSETP